MASQRFEITGLPPKIKSKLSDFPQSERTKLFLQINTLADELLVISRLLLASIAQSGTLRQNVQNPNLFRYAALFYGDVRKWNALMDVSDLPLPVLNTEGVDGVDVIFVKELRR